MKTTCNDNPDIFKIIYENRDQYIKLNEESNNDVTETFFNFAKSNNYIN
jgi:hypothetical protein